MAGRAQVRTARRRAKAGPRPVADPAQEEKSCRRCRSGRESCLFVKPGESLARSRTTRPYDVAGLDGVVGVTAEVVVTSPWRDSCCWVTPSAGRRLRAAPG